MNSRSESNKKSHRSLKPAVPIGMWAIVWGSVSIITCLAVWGLAQNPLYASKSYWLVSRAAAISSYLLLTVAVLLGMTLSHPRNKDTWQASKIALPWHQAIIPIFLSLLTTHLVFTVLDAKSGVLPINLVLPLDAHYRPYAMLLGSMALGLFLLVLLTSVWPGVFRGTWIKIHHLAPFVWIAVWLHGMFAGTDATTLYYLYLFTGVTVIGFYLWRQWVRPIRAKTMPVQEK